MMRAAGFCGIFLSVVVLANACSDSRVPPTGPTPPPPTSQLPPATAPEPPLPPGSFPPVSITGRIYHFSQPLHPWPIDAGTRASRFVLGENGTFAMQFATHVHGGWNYYGTYEERDGVITFAWNDFSQGAATGTLADDTLTVRYNTFMSWTDFGDAIYRRTP